MKKYLPLFISLLILAACAKQEQTPSSTVLAKVGGIAITQEEFDDEAKLLDKDFSQYLSTKAGKDDFLQFMIRERLLDEAARKEGIESSQAYTDEIEKIKEEQAKSLALAREFTLRRMLSEKLSKNGILNVSEDEIQQYYSKYHYQIYIMQILLSDADEAATVMRAVHGITSPQAFAYAAQKYSIDPQSKDNGGRLPPFIPGEYMPQIEVPAANVPPGKVQGFIKTGRGFHIIMKVKEENLSYAEAKDRIHAILEKQKMDAYLNSLKDKYGVEVINEGQ